MPAPLKKQLDALRGRRVLFAHLTTFFFLAGHFTLYGYLTPFVISTMGFGGAVIALVYFVSGAAAGTGGGVARALADKFGARSTLLSSTALLTVRWLLIAHTTHVPAVRRITPPRR